MVCDGGGAPHLGGGRVGAQVAEDRECRAPAACFDASGHGTRVCDHLRTISHESVMTWRQLHSWAGNVVTL